MFISVPSRASCWLLMLAATSVVQAKSYRSNQQQSSDEDESLAVIPSPNDQLQVSHDIKRVAAKQEIHLAAAPSETAVPVYVSPYVRPERAANHLFDSSSASSHAPPNYAPKPSMILAQPAKDLKTAASYGHHHHGGYGGDHHDSSGWLDMGAWTGGKGSFGWYADYPVGGKHYGHGHGRK